MRIRIAGIACPGISVLVISSTLLTGCASGLSKEECAVVDWRTIGYEDGLKGRPQSRVSEHRKDCAEHGVILDLETYRDGWGEGVDSYCRTGNAYRQGRYDADYYGICPPHLEEAFLAAYGSGRRLYNMEQEVRRLERDLNSARHRLERVEVEIRDTGLELVAPDLATSQRIILLDELRRLEAEHSELRNRDIPGLEHQLVDRRSELAAMRAAHE